MHIYKITNKINHKVYIGQTIQNNPKMRWYAHLDYVRKGRKSHLYDSIRKHGVENFEWQIIDQCETVEELNELETKWLAHYRALGEVYNNREAGGNKKHSAESIERMRLAQKQAHARRRAKSGGKELHNPHKPHSGGWNHRRVSCVCCKRTTSINSFGRDHGNKCKQQVNI